MSPLFPIVTVVPGNMPVREAASLAARTNRRLFLTRSGHAVIAHHARRGWVPCAVPTGSASC